MRHRIPAPCEHWDIERNCHKDSCPDLIAIVEGDPCECDYWEDNCSDEDVASDDMNHCCRVRREDYEDKQTIDLFGGKTDNTSD